MRYFLSLIVLGLGLGSLQAKTISLPDEKAAVKFEAPKGWTVEEIERGVSLDSPDKEVTILLEVIPASKLDSLIEENIDWLKKENKIVFEKKTGADATFFNSGKAWGNASWNVNQEDWGKGRVIFSFLAPNAKQMLMTTCWVTTKGEKEQGKALQALFASVTSTTPDEAPDKPAPGTFGGGTAGQEKTDAASAGKPAPGTFGGGPAAKAETDSATEPTKENPSRVNPPRQPSHHDKPEADATVDASLLIGMWLERKYVSFYEDGRVGIQRNEESPVDDKGRSWKLKGDQLTWVTPDGTSTDTVVSLTRQKMVLKDSDGNLSTYKRIGD